MTCDEYLQDPDEHAAHLQSCEICRSIEEELGAGVAVETRPLNVEALPMAAWEGASHRTWPLVAAGLVAMMTLAIVLSAAAGISPVAAVTSSLPSVQALLTFLQLTGHALGAPLVGLLFVGINTILFLLLRRAPKGVDV